MGGQKADLVFTDPPYNVDYEDYTEEKLKIQGDRMTPEQFQQFLNSVFSSYIYALKTGRSSRLMELDPKYCDVIVKRWQEFTGKTALLEDGRTFSELDSLRQTRQVA